MIRDWTPCIGRQILNLWTTRKVPVITVRFFAVQVEAWRKIMQNSLFTKDIWAPALGVPLASLGVMPPDSHLTISLPSCLLWVPLSPSSFTLTASCVQYLDATLLLLPSVLIMPQRASCKLALSTWPKLQVVVLSLATVLGAPQI